MTIRTVARNFIMVSNHNVVHSSSPYNLVTGFSQKDLLVRGLTFYFNFYRGDGSVAGPSDKDLVVAVLQPICLVLIIVLLPFYFWPRKGFRSDLY